MRPSVRSASAIALAILALTPHSSAEGVHIVGAPGLGPFDELQQAVDAAAPGDTLLVAGGQYAAFTIAGKALFVRAAPGQVVRVHGPVVVRDLAPAQVVVLAGLTVDAPAPSAPVPEGLPALVGLDIAGHLRLEDCSLRAASGFPAPFTGTSFGAGGDGLRLVDCAQVGLLGCTLAGGAGGGASQGASVDAGGRGGAGVRASGATRLALHECDLRGGAGGSSLGSGGDGGHALWLQGQGAFAAGGVLLGGSGGHALGTDCSRPPGNGGHGVHIGAVTETQSKGASFAGGSPGLGLTCGGSGAPGEPTAGPGLFVPFAELPRVLEADAVVLATGGYGNA